MNLSVYEVESLFSLDQILLFNYWAQRRQRRQMKYDEFAIRVAVSGFVGGAK